MIPIRPEECEFPEILLRIRDFPGEKGRRQAEEKRALIAAIRSNQTARYRIEADIILGMIENEAPVPPEIATNIRWPHRETTYIEYNGAIRLDSTYPDDRRPEFIKGNLIVSGDTTAEIRTVGTKGLELFVVQHVMDLEMGTAANTFVGHVPEELRRNDIQRAQRFFARLAAYTRAFAARISN